VFPRGPALIYAGVAIWVAGLVLLVIGTWDVGAGLLLLGVVCVVLGVISRFELGRRLLNALSFWS
jgi:membrane-bound ClpP family serine protease